MEHKEMEKLNTEELDQVTGGNRLPKLGRPVKQIIQSVICGGHEWVPTGRTVTKTRFYLPFDFDFLKYTQNQYICTKCGKKKWVEAD